MISTTNGTLAASARGRRSIDPSLMIRRFRSGTRTTLGALAFRALARALACLVPLGGVGRVSERDVVAFSGPERDAGVSRPCGGAVARCRRARREDGGSAVRRIACRAPPSERSQRRTGA